MHTHRLKAEPEERRCGQLDFRVTVGYRRMPMATFGNIWSPSVITSASCWSPIQPRHDSTSRGSLGS